jgi:hypothetical protein
MEDRLNNILRQTSKMFQNTSKQSRDPGPKPNKLTLT